MFPGKPGVGLAIVRLTWAIRVRGKRGAGLNITGNFQPRQLLGEPHGSGLNSFGALWWLKCIITGRPRKAWNAGSLPIRNVSTQGKRKVTSVFKT